MLRGKAAFGCSRWKEGCQFRLPTEFEGKKLTDKQAGDLLKKGRTQVMKGFLDDDGHKFDAAVLLTPARTLELVRAAESKPTTAQDPGQIPCPVCRLGQMLRGNSAWGCSRFREDCQFRVPFDLGRQNPHRHPDEPAPAQGQNRRHPRLHFQQNRQPL